MLSKLKPAILALEKKQKKGYYSIYICVYYIMHVYSA